MTHAILLQNPMAPTSGDKEGVKEGGESALLAQVQALLQQQQQQVAIQVNTSPASLSNALPTTAPSLPLITLAVLC